MKGLNNYMKNKYQKMYKESNTESDDFLNKIDLLYKLVQDIDSNFDEHIQMSAKEMNKVAGSLAQILPTLKRLSFKLDGITPIRVKEEISGTAINNIQTSDSLPQSQTPQNGKKKVLEDNF